MNKFARAIRDEYGIPYAIALRWIRDLGLEAAIELAQKAKIPERKKRAK